MALNSQDKELRDLLRTYGAGTPRPSADFRTGVWARIEARRRVPATWGEWVRLHLAGFATAAAASVVLSAAGGGWLATIQVDRERDVMVSRYVTSIDPHSQVMRTQDDLTR
jgi:hypothetical protein